VSLYTVPKPEPQSEHGPPARVVPYRAPLRSARRAAHLGFSWPLRPYHPSAEGGLPHQRRGADPNRRSRRPRYRPHARLALCVGDCFRRRATGACGLRARQAFDQRRPAGRPVPGQQGQGVHRLFGRNLRTGPKSRPIAGRGDADRAQRRSPPDAPSMNPARSLQRLTGESAGPPDQYHPTFSAAKGPVVYNKGARRYLRPRPTTPHPQPHGCRGPFFLVDRASSAATRGIGSIPPCRNSTSCQANNQAPSNRSNHLALARSLYSSGRCFDGVMFDPHSSWHTV
jgi:hypothetical protein